MPRTVSALKNDGLVWAARALNGSFARPDWVSINLTLRCNLKCTMCTTCYDAPELSRGQVFDIIDQVSAWGVKILNPLGGEPFVREDLLDILEYASSKDLYVTVTTNGTLISEESARRVADIPTSRLHFNLSLDGFAEVHDKIRGRGMFDEAVKGFHRLREAEAAQGLPPRKVVVNTVINDMSLDAVPDFIRWAKDEGFQGVQLLNLFKHGKGVPREIKHLWIHPERWPVLDRVVDEVKALKKTFDPTAFTIVNSPHQLDIMKQYYRDDLPPREAPCFAGWKELYINTDGQGIMCDGKLDFLNGQFGDVHRQTLRQMWESEELSARRAVVKKCDSPCIQDCYLREPSSHMWKIVQGVGEIALEQVKKRVRKPQAKVPLSGTELTLELADMTDLPAPWDAPQVGDRFQGVIKACPAPFEAAYEDPFLFYDYRNKGYLNFNRGFMGFELLPPLGEGLGRGKARFDHLHLGWRGEPTLHPEFARILEWGMSEVSAGHFGEMRLTTHGALLNTEVVDKSLMAKQPQTWIINIDAATPKMWKTLRGQDRLSAVERNIDYLLARRQALGEDCVRLVLAFTCGEANSSEAEAFRDVWLGRFKGHNLGAPAISAGPMPPGDGIWFKREEKASFMEQLEATRRLEAVAQALGIPVLGDRDTGAAPRCASPFKTPTVSWDGKVTLCTQDTALSLRAGEITVEDLVDIWWRKPVPADARKAALGGTLHQRSPCRDCRFPFSPTAPELSEEEVKALG